MNELFVQDNIASTVMVMVACDEAQGLREKR